MPCIIWGVTLGEAHIIKNKIIYYIYSKSLLSYSTVYIVNLLITLLYIPIFFSTHKKYLPTLYHTHHKLYVTYSILAVSCIVMGILFIRTKFWSYLLNGSLIYPLLEELIARSILYEARNKGFRLFALIAIITSISFSLMHFGYEPSALLDTSNILFKFSQHFIFGLQLCAVFWFIPRLELLSLLHALSNLYYTLTHAAELGL